ncbi:MAG: InlB B-repeat-containing protein [Gracilibacteraceae bacterium]|jgi:hypothetical protein|nr:InlB B-repeat-containing protein [Gracilibacteraceae bacterium]
MKPQSRWLALLFPITLVLFLGMTCFVPDVHAAGEKTVTATFISFDGTEQVTGTTNNGGTMQVQVPSLSDYPGGWEAREWVDLPGATNGGFSPQQVQSIWIADDMTFYGVYERQVTLAFETDGGEAQGNISCSQFVNSSDAPRTVGGQTFLLPSGGDKEGAIFDGWVLKGAGGVKYQPGWSFIDLQGAGDATMVAQWTPIQFAVTYNYGTNGGAKPITGEETTSVPINSGDIVNQNPLDPPAEKAGTGWQFLGWSTNQNAHEPDSPFPLTKNEDLYAIYQKELIVKFIDYDGGSKITTPYPTPVFLFNNEPEATVATSDFPAQHIYQEYFTWNPKGWSKSTEVDAEPIQAESDAISADTTYYGLYQLTGTVSYDTKCSEPLDPESVTHYATSANINARDYRTMYLPDPSALNPDFTFLYWKSSISGRIFYPGDPCQPGEPVTMIAFWQVKPQYTVTYHYDINGGSEKGTGNPTSVDTVVAGTTVDPADLITHQAEKEGAGWQFLGWSTNQNAHEAGDPFQVTKNEDLYAIYKRSVTVRLIDYEGEQKQTRDDFFSDEETTLYNNDPLSLTFPEPGIYTGTYGGWIPVGWSSSRSKEATPEYLPGSYTISAGLVPSGVVELYGLYQKSIKVDFKPNGGKPEPPEEILVLFINSFNINDWKTQDITLPTATAITRNGFILSAWISGASGRPCNPGEVLAPLLDITYSAAWTPLESDDDSPQYLAMHKLDSGISSENRWTANDPLSFAVASSWEELTALGAGSPDRRLAVAFTFNFNVTRQETLVESIVNMMKGAEDYDVPIFIHLDGVNYWYYTGLWKWWNNDADFVNRGARDAHRYSPDNINNVERYDWGMDTALKISWRDWGRQQRNETPPPNLASKAFRDNIEDGLSNIIPVIANWYNGLPNDKKYLLAGVVMGQELSPWWGAYYYHFEDNNGSLIDGNNYWDESFLNLSDGNRFAAFQAQDIANNLTGGPTGAWDKIEPLGYAAAQTLWEQGIRDNNLQEPGTGKITPETTGFIIKDYLNFVIQKTQLYGEGIPTSKIVTHCLCTRYHLQMPAATDIDGVIPGWTTNNRLIDEGLAPWPSTLNALAGKRWSAIEVDAIKGKDGENPIYLTAEDINAIFNYGNCRHVNIKQWEQIRNSQEAKNAISEALN